MHNRSPQGVLRSTNVPFPATQDPAGVPSTPIPLLPCSSRTQTLPTAPESLRGSQGGVDREGHVLSNAEVGEGVTVNQPLPVGLFLVDILVSTGR